ncbi:methyltransferase domain-containing protein [Verrucomicrobium sp. BvORR034]|uniref:methyltransferase domain-containing protein n=1 Tax=Verrucomicrobium sp. BvORR034 TaxID=1396418 RepID=UPI002240E93D|nr:methyltransferase domain-containing protein [Verrucomicrobium sp. BvORR034]
MSPQPKPSWWKRARHVPGRLRTRLWLMMGRPMPITSQDRKVLETIILPKVAAEHHRVLFVGCEIYTAHYRTFFRRNDYHTLDYDPAKQRYGARQHKVGSATELDRYYPAEWFDAVIFNGVLGYGIDELAGAEAAIAACRTVLKPGGLLVVGWNDRPEVRALVEASQELQHGLKPVVFEPLGVVQTEPIDVVKHVYSFFVKEEAGRQ